MTARTYTPSEFRAEFIERRQGLARSREDRDAIRKMAELVSDNTAYQIGDQIVDLVTSGKRPGRELLEAWCRGGAVFWLDDHVSLGEGWPIIDFFGEEDLPVNNPVTSRRNAARKLGRLVSSLWQTLREGSDSCQRRTRGSPHFSLWLWDG